MSEPEAREALAKTARDNARIPMRWNNRKGYGFTDGTPWIDGGKDEPEYNVAREERDPSSVLAFYREAIRVWKDPLYRELIRDGAFEPDYLEMGDWICYTRRIGERRLRVFANFSPRTYEKPDIPGTILLHNYEDVSEEFRPYEVYVTTL